jgi:hypothetical protein
VKAQTHRLVTSGTIFGWPGGPGGVHGSGVPACGWLGKFWNCAVLLANSLKQFVFASNSPGNLATIHYVITSKSSENTKSMTLESLPFLVCINMTKSNQLFLPNSARFPDCPVLLIGIYYRSYIGGRRPVGDSEPRRAAPVQRSAGQTRQCRHST